MGNSLCLDDLQKFMKRLRKKFAPKTIRFFACGEYGETNPITKAKDGGLYRPHYHVLLFGEDFHLDRKYLKKSQSGSDTFTSETLTKLWGKGYCNIGSLNYQTAAYTARYCMKKVGGQLAETHYQRIDQQTGEIYMLKPEFAVMSRNPGLGAQWYERFKSDAFPSDFLVHQGKKVSVPKFYTRKLKRQEEDLHKQIKEKRQAAINSDRVNHTPERLAVREEVKRAQISTLKRNM